jgi:hypothetical protein
MKCARSDEVSQLRGIEGEFLGHRPALRAGRGGGVRVQQRIFPIVTAYFRSKAGYEARRCLQFMGEHMMCCCKS